MSHVGVVVGTELARRVIVAPCILGRSEQEVHEINRRVCTARVGVRASGFALDQ